MEAAIPFLQHMLMTVSAKNLRGWLNWWKVTVSFVVFLVVEFAAIYFIYSFVFSRQ